MRFSSTLLLGVQLTLVLSLPAPQKGSHGVEALQESPAQGARERGPGAGAAAGPGAGAGAGAGAGGRGNNVVTVTVTAGAPAATPPPAAGAPPAGGGRVEEDAEKENEVELAGIFGTASALQGGELKQDVLFTKSATGAFEFEFQGANADELTVVENTTPAAPPAGFVAIEPNSFKVSLAVSKGAGLTLSKIDYIFDGTNAALAGMDLTKSQVGKLCTEANAFIIDANLGELEFELEENEVTLNLNKAVTAEGEWGIFLPVAAAAGGAGAGNATGEARGPGRAGEVKEKGKGPGAKGEGPGVRKAEKLVV